MTFPLRRPLVRSLALLGCALALSCGSDGPFFRMSFGLPDTLTAIPGESLPVEITVQRTGDDQSQYRIGLSNAPEGVSLSPEIILPEGEATVTATPTYTVAPETEARGLFRSLVLATNAAETFATSANLFLVILSPPAPQPDFSITVEPRQLNLFAGQNAKVRITVTRAEGFTGPVTVSLDSPTRRISMPEVTIPADQTFVEPYVDTDRGITRVPVAAGIVATSEDGRQATTGFSINVR
ncbi:hypothetical protein [Comamonas sp. JC664]|uniref:COG1470 family protein n=1 Tax=Comamonas sp. JC664 TaxID=2801917 RepID=UPI00174A2DFC|nr:hypothetical protein [Comamonas sp. JC664]MBL0697688.1 hypothetical protein [Comamonas sp. JC664]GHG69025.1 hypothetical protein GCM10012319_12800 [Comamonas sp. KCTC 72670]